MERTFGEEGGTWSSPKSVHATQYLLVNPSCVSMLRSISKNLSNVRQSDTIAKEYVTQGILDLLPSVIRQSSKKVVLLGLEILGALSLSSQTVNRWILSKRDVIRALTDKFTSSDIDLLSAAFRTLEDVLVTPESLQLVEDTILIENLLRALCLFADLSARACTGLTTEGSIFFEGAAADSVQTPHVPDVELARKSSDVVFVKELENLADVCVRILSTLFPVQKIKDVPKPVYLKALRVLQQQWLFLQEEDQRLYDRVDPSTWDWYKVSKSRHELAKCLMLLGMEYDYFSSESEEVSCTIMDVSSLEFREKFWEASPLLVSKALPSCLISFATKYTPVEKLLKDLLSRFRTCPTASADLEPSLYFLDLDHSLGDPMIYGRDIRIMKTPTDVDGNKSNESEEHLFAAEPECDANHFIHPRVMLKAVKMGFSLALKGLELRCSDIARVADAIARQFGQPSVGVNMYITPPNAQGLAVHFDDHCVFVCQLQGHKSWKIFPPVQILPRLYGPRCLEEEELKDSTVEQVRLEEGDVLYIPRGYPHKAFCENKPEGKSDGADSCFNGIRDLGTGETSESEVATPGNSADPLSGRCKKRRITSSCLKPAEEQVETPRNADNCVSVHLTFGVEVEPPFEWEGLVHVALRLWMYQRWKSSSGPNPKSHNDEEALCEALLHVAIRSIDDVRFRKACLIAAEPPHSRVEEALESEREENTEVEIRASGCGALDSSGCSLCSQSALTYFQGLIATVAERVSFSEALKVARSYVKNETGETDVAGMEWLRHVPIPNEHLRDLENSDPLHLLQQFDLEKLACEKTFTNMKVEFGQALIFHDASQVFRIILNRCRTTRRKIRNGMLALHGGLTH